jgi:hypothetical protein
MYWAKKYYFLLYLYITPVGLNSDAIVFLFTANCVVLVNGLKINT